jgi:hypothetical protein
MKLIKLKYTIKGYPRHGMGEDGHMYILPYIDKAGKPRAAQQRKIQGGRWWMADSRKWLTKASLAPLLEEVKDEVVLGVE